MISSDHDTRTLQELAQEALDEDGEEGALALSRALLSWHKSYCRLRDLIGSEQAARHHEITTLWANKVQRVVAGWGLRDDARIVVERIAKEDTHIHEPC